MLALRASLPGLDARRGIHARPRTNDVQSHLRTYSGQEIGSLPIVHNHNLVGIITETDIFQTTAEGLDGYTKGIHVGFRIPEKKGELAFIAHTVTRLSGNIISMTIFFGNGPQHR